MDPLRLSLAQVRKGNENFGAFVAQGPTAEWEARGDSAGNVGL